MFRSLPRAERNTDECPYPGHVGTRGKTDRTNGPLSAAFPPAICRFRTPFPPDFAPLRTMGGTAAQTVKLALRSTRRRLENCPPERKCARGEARAHVNPSSGEQPFSGSIHFRHYTALELSTP